jgi:hypothetical protein
MAIQGVAPFAFQGFDVLSWLPDGIDGRSADWSTPQERVDVPSGAFAITAPALHPAHGHKAIYRCFARADHAVLWTWLAALLGRYTSFWCPTFQRDLEILNPTSLGTWVIRFAGFAATFAADPSAKYLYGFVGGGINGVAIKVLTAVDNGDGTETITYDTNALRIAGSGGIGVYVTTVTTAAAASVLRFVRLDTDTITQSFVTTGIVDVTVSFVSITGEQP